MDVPPPIPPRPDAAKIAAILGKTPSTSSRKPGPGSEQSNMEQSRTPFSSQSGTYKMKNMFGSSQPPRLPPASKEESHMYMCFGKSKAPPVPPKK